MKQTEDCTVYRDSAMEDRDDMHCMEVRGGNRAANEHFVRPGLDVWIWSRSQGSAEAGGGDLHLVSSCASGRITRMLLADICGCGTPFADIANRLRDLMKRNVNSIQQAKFVRHMSRQLERASYQGVFASTLISTYFAPTRSFTFCNAGHPPPLFFRAKTGEWSPLKQVPAETSSVDSPLGVVALSEYQESKTKLDVGDMVFSYSNSLTECRGKDGNFLGVEGLVNRLRSLNPQKPSSLVGDLLTQIQDEHGDNLAADDTTLLLCLATEKSVGWRDNVLAPFRLLRPVSDHTTVEHVSDEGSRPM